MPGFRGRQECTGLLLPPPPPPPPLPPPHSPPTAELWEANQKASLIFLPDGRVHKTIKVCWPPQLGYERHTQGQIYCPTWWQSGQDYTDLLITTTWLWEAYTGPELLSYLGTERAGLYRSADHNLAMRGTHRAWAIVLPRDRAGRTIQICWSPQLGSERHTQGLSYCPT